MIDQEVITRILPFIIIIFFVLSRVVIDNLAKRAQEQGNPKPRTSEMESGPADDAMEREWSLDTTGGWEEDWKRKLKEQEEESKKKIAQLQKEAHLTVAEPMEEDKKEEKKIAIKFEQDYILQGIIFSEIIRPPRSRRMFPSR